MDFIPEYLDLHNSSNTFTKSFAKFMSKRGSEGITINNKLFSSKTSSGIISKKVEVEEPSKTTSACQ